MPNFALDYFQLKLNFNERDEKQKFSNSLKFGFIVFIFTTQNFVRRGSSAG